MASVLLTLILWVAGIQGRGQPSVSPAGTEWVSGTVMQGETQRPLPGVRVELRREEYGVWLSGHEKPCGPVRDINDPKLHRYATTDANGRFSFQNVVPGRYYLLAEHEGYLRAEYGQSKGLFPRGRLLEVGLQDNALRPGLPSSVLEDMVLRLYPAPTIIGRVHNEDGARVPAAIVQLYQHRFAPMNGRTLKPVRSIFTDDNGEYRLFWLNPGRYVIAAAYSDYVLQPWTDKLRFTPNLPDSDNRYPVVFYPGVEKPSEAFPVQVGAAAAQPVDVELWKRPRFNVEIRLSGSPAPPNTTVVVVPFGGDLCAAMDFGIVPQSDGVVVVRDVPAGRYLVVAVSGRESLSELLPLVVDQHIRDFRLPIVPPVDIPVSVTTSPTSGMEGVRVVLTRTGNEVSHVISAEHDSEGKLLFKGVGPGSYYVTADAPPGYYVSGATAYRLIPENPLDPCTPPPPPGPPVRSEASRNYSYLDEHGHLNKDKPLIVSVVIPGDARCVSVSIRLGALLFGRAVDRLGMPAAGSLIVGLPRSVWGGQDSAVAFTPPDRYLTTTTDAEGRFVLSGAVPGTEYKLFAFEDLDPNLTYDPDLVDRFPNRDLIDLEETAGTNAPLQNRTQQLRGQRSVRLQGSSAFRADVNTGPCSPSLLCVLRTISAEETRELNMGRN